MRLLALVLLVFACGASVAGTAPPSLLIFSDPASASHRTIVDHIVSTFEARHGTDARLVVHHLGDQSITDSRLQAHERAMVVTVGAKAAADVSRHPPDLPVLNVFLPQATHRYLQLEHRHKSAAIVLDQPLFRQLALARVLLPSAQRAGMLSSGAATTPGPLSRRPASELGFELTNVPVQDDDTPVDAIREVLRASDVVIVTFDPHVYTPVMAKWLLYMALQQQRPIIGFSHALLEAGAVGSVFSTPEQIAEQTTEAIEDWLETGEGPAGVAYPRYYHIGLNAPVARQLGIKTPDKPELERKVRRLSEESQ